MFRGLFLLTLGWIAWAITPPVEPEARWRGHAAPVEPWQSSDDLPASWTDGEYTFQPLARFTIRALVLGRRDYDDEVSSFCPTDLALGWGWMSDAELVAHTDVTYQQRWIDVRWPVKTPVTPAELLRSCTNLHAIPASNLVRARLREVSRHEIVELTGYLVTVVHRDGREWKTSLSRDDEGMGACEVMWIEGLQHGPVGS